MTDNNDVRKVDKDLKNSVINDVENSSEKIELRHDTTTILELTDTASTFQTIVNNSNISIATSAILSASRLVNVTNCFFSLECLSTSILIDKRSIDDMLKVVTSYNKVWANENSQAIKKITEAARNLIDNYQIDCSNILKNINEFLRSLPSKYTQDEIEQITSRIQCLAESGWVIYFRDRNTYSRLIAEEWSVLEVEWIELLRDKLRDGDFIIDLQESEGYSKPLVKSMIECYLNQNFYAAYTLGSLAIDGALSRVSERFSSNKRIPVGYKAVEEIDTIFVEKTLSDVGLMHWLYNFFKDTNRFTLDEPNRHMIGHGRWDREIEEKDFLKLFNTILYIYDEYDNWLENVDTIR